MAGFGSFFTSFASIFYPKTPDDQNKVDKAGNNGSSEGQGRVQDAVVYRVNNSEVGKDTPQSDKGPVEAQRTRKASQTERNDQARKATAAMERAKRVEDAHRRTAKQTQLGRAAVIYSENNNPVELRLAEFEKRRQETRLVNGVTGRKRERDDQNKSAPLSNTDPNENPFKKQKTKTTTPLERQTQKLKDLATPKFLGMTPNFQETALKNNGFDNSALENLGFNSPKEAIKQMRMWTKEAAEKEKLTEEGPPRTKVRKSVKDELGKDLQEGVVRNIPLMEFQEEKAREWWRGIAKRTLGSKDVSSVTIGKKGTLTREEAVQLGFIRGGKGSGGGRGMGG